MIIRPDQEDLTICSVSFHSKSYLELNIELVKQRNPHLKINWIIAENTPGGFDWLNNNPNVTFTEGFPNLISQRRPASYQHGLALNKIIQLVQTRFVLILDPDFYIIRKNWAHEVLDHIQVRDLAFWGVPWHPKWFTKYRYFPCVHCLLIDLEQVSKQELDFTPEVTPIADTTVRSVRRTLAPLVPDIIRKLVLARQAVGQSDDTGYRLYRQFYNHRTLKAECITPVFEPKQDLEMYNSRLSTWFLAFEGFLSERHSYIPKKKNYYTQKGFREMSYPDTRSRNWEEFLWKDEPFGFHVRGFMQKNRNPEGELHAITSFMEFLTNLERENDNGA